MKNLFFLLLLIPILSFGQNEIITVDGDTIYAQDAFVSKKQIVYTNLNNNNRETLDIQNIHRFNGKTFKSLKRKVITLNPTVKFDDKKVHNTTVYNQNKFNSSFTAGDYLIKAGQSYQTGVVLTIAGAGGAVAAAASDSDEIAVAGGAVALVGFIYTIIGHSQLIKAGKKLNNKGMALKPSSAGVGLALVF